MSVITGTGRPVGGAEVLDAIGWAVGGSTLLSST